MHAVHAVLPALLDEQRPCTFAPNHEYNLALAAVVADMSVRDKREIFAAMRQPNITPNTFLPRHGISIAELTVMQVLSERPRPAGSAACAGSVGSDSAEAASNAATSTAAVSAASAARGDGGGEKHGLA